MGGNSQIYAKVVIWQFLIINERTAWDLFGDFIYYRGICKSAIDYIIMVNQCLENVAHFRVSEHIMYLSNHCFLHTVLKCHMNIQAATKTSNKMRELYNRFIWKSESIALF